MFDEQPDGDPHGECAAEILRLEAENSNLVAELRNIADADPSTWEPEVRDQFREWAQSRARAAIAATGQKGE